MKHSVSAVVVAFLLLVQAGVSAATKPATPAAARLAAPARFSKYDDHFRKYTKRFFGVGFDWRFFKAQAIVESNLRPDAVSPVGARGLMQVMPATYADIRRRHKEFGSIDNPEWSIAAGISYSRDLYTYWINEADESFQKHFMLGSYNAGRTTMIRAQKVALESKLDHRVWSSIEAIASTVPRWRYSETLPYVQAVFVNLETMDRQGRTDGPTVSLRDDSGTSLTDQLRKLRVLKGAGSSVKSAFKRLRDKLN